MDKETEARLHKDLVRLGDMMGDGLHKEPGGSWISRDYKRTARALGLLPKRKSNGAAINEAVAKALETTRCPKCGGKLKRTRSGSYVVECIECKEKFTFNPKRRKNRR